LKGTTKDAQVIVGTHKRPKQNHSEKSSQDIIKVIRMSFEEEVEHKLLQKLNLFHDKSHLLFDFELTGAAGTAAPSIHRQSEWRRHGKICRPSLSCEFISNIFLTANKRFKRIKAEGNCHKT